VCVCACVNSTVYVIRYKCIILSLVSPVGLSVYGLAGRGSCRADKERITTPACAVGKRLSLLY
jgi:hypothetical protein